MLDIHGEEIEEGERVRLRNADYHYTIGKSNPLIGTKFECEGVYTGDGEMVEWVNGYSNSYKDGELERVDANCVDLWKEI